MKNNIFSRKLIAFPRREMYDAMNDNNNNMWEKSQYFNGLWFIFVWISRKKMKIDNTAKEINIKEIFFAS